MLGRTNGGFGDEWFPRMSERTSNSLAPVGLAALAVAGAVGGAAVVSKAFKSSPLGAAPSSVSPASAARFLTQASFGATDSSIADVRSAGIQGWIANQQAMPISGSHLAYVQNRINSRRTSPNKAAKALLFNESFWLQAVTAPDQLRQRVKFALSEIFVISILNATLQYAITGAANYYDILAANAFGNFRTLLEQVTLNPMMGVYLTYFANLPANPATGRHPDENYAREVMQLMTVGLYKLNQDGTVQTDTDGNPVATYSHDDIAGLAAVFTGFSWYSANPVATGPNNTFYPKLGLLPVDPAAIINPMIPYPVYHQTTAKSFLGVTIPASTTPDPVGDLKIALDTLFNHSNVGPFFGKQLIQRLVTSNPSPAYISRVAGVFNDDGTGVRGNIGAVVKAVLLDPEARDDTVATSATFGKLREPIVRVANWARAFNASSTTGFWTVPNTSAPMLLDQTALTAPSVFNFFALGYTPPGTSTSAAGLVAPEFQVVNEISVAGYLNFMESVITIGLGSPPPGSRVPDIRTTYANEVALANTPADLVARLNLLLLNGQMSVALQNQIINVVSSVSVPASPPAAIGTALAQRVQLAAFMTFASPEYIVQR